MEPGTYLQHGRYQILPSNFETGRSGIPLLALDLQTREKVFIKRTDIYSLHVEEQNRDLENEANALKTMAGHGAPALLDEFVERLLTDHKTSEIRYIVMEYVGDGEWINNNYPSIPHHKKVDIIHQLFACLATAHEQRITNGDVDIRHLVWKDAKNQLILIDWGNARLDVSDNAAYLFDLIRAAEILYLLFTLENFPTNLQEPLSNFPTDAPKEFREFCEWARNANKESPSLWTAKKLQEIANDWNSRIIEQLVEQADDAYYSGDFEESIEYYHEVLGKNPSNERVQAQVKKAEYNKLAQKRIDVVPREALVYYYRARSLLAAGMVEDAIVNLQIALKIAQEAGVDFPAVTQVLKSIETDRKNAAAAEIHRDDALAAIEGEQWSVAMTHLEKALSVNSNDLAARTLLDQLRSLLKARGLIEQLIAGIGKKSIQEKYLSDIEIIIQDTSETPFLSVLWREVVKGVGEFKQKPTKNNTLRIFLWASIVSLSIILLALSLVYLLPHRTVVVDCSKILPGLSASVGYPTYLANGDDAELQLTLTNDASNSQPVSGTILVDFIGTANVRMLNSSGSNVVEFPSLNPGQRLSQSIPFALNEPVKLIADPSRYVDFNIRLIGASDSCTPNNFHIAIAPLYGLKKLIAIMWSTLGVTLVGLFWQQIKRQLGIG